MARYELRFKTSVAKDLRGIAKVEVKRILARIKVTPQLRHRSRHLRRPHQPGAYQESRKQSKAGRFHSTG